jgi:hypothetical protein
MELEFRKFPDEDRIEQVLELLYSIAWEGRSIDSPTITQLLDRLNWVLGLWGKPLASNTLAEIVRASYLNHITSDETSRPVIQKLDLIICFFHHYIYAFDEFMNRKFRHSVIRCGLVCERIIKRIAVASGTQTEQIIRFEDKVNKLKSVLEPTCSGIDHLSDLLQYVYHQRTKTGAHDYRAANALIAKSCITIAPTIYMLYLDTLGEIGFDIQQKENLLELVNSTISTGTSLIVTEEGKPVKAEQVLESLYKQRYFVSEVTLKDVENKLKTLTYSFPKPTLFKALAKLSGREQILLKKGKTYVQRLPPEEYYRKEIVA